MLIAQVTVGISLIVMALLLLLAYHRPDANPLTRALHAHWRSEPTTVWGTGFKITYDKYFLIGAVVLAIVAVRTLVQALRGL
jgi:hypothetical protein